MKGEGEERSDEQETAFITAHVKLHLDAFEATSRDTQTVRDTPRMHQFPDENRSNVWADKFIGEMRTKPQRRAESCKRLQKGLLRLSAL